ncbi:MAG: copper amine oxidase N-terminal domain-containing protein [Candidatus Tyrphobacter sp.]
MGALALQLSTAFALRLRVKLSVIGLVFLFAVAGHAPACAAAVQPSLGTSPSGQIPILYNDHHVYSKPDVLKQDRVLSALIRGNTILIPLRSMFEQMGATVSYDAATRTVDVSKAGADVKVTVGKPEVVINGETRPLDVPPIIYHGIVLVPVRVISEGMGAYVQWVPDRHIVVVRYIPPVPPPLPTEQPAPPVPLPAPIIVPTPRSYRGFIAGAFAAIRNYNEFSAGGYCPAAYVLSAAYAFRDSGFAIKVDYRQDAYVTRTSFIDVLGNHYTRFATIDGGTASTPAFLARQSTLDARLEYQIAAPRIYAGVGYLTASNNYGYPNLNAFGAGIEKLPDLRSGIGLFGSVFYYPSAAGTYTVTSASSSNFGSSYRQQYQIVKYDVGLTFAVARSSLYVYGGFSDDQYIARQNAPIGQTHAGPYIGVGLRF